MSNWSHVKGKQTVGKERVAAFLNAREKVKARGVDPLDMLFEIYELAKQAFKDQRGYGEKSDAGAAYLSVAGTAASNIAKYVYPTISAVKVEHGQAPDMIPMDIKEAIQVISSDPFAKVAIQAMEVQASKLPTDVPFDTMDLNLPKGINVNKPG